MSHRDVSPHTPLEMDKTMFLASLFCPKVTRTTPQSTKSEKNYWERTPRSPFVLILINLTTDQSVPTPNKGIIITRAELVLGFRNMALTKTCWCFFEHHSAKFLTPDVGPSEGKKNPRTNFTTEQACLYYQNSTF